ncbi:(2Fe-2S)-binding protein [Echinicola sp. CAU 1574]|uniref:(2Fe-2S)-binding protein n=1 Tax=Echinicola arenosa TaxID=2774144 RepID=A0ABR9ALZ5_9BACT|nr:(2Fe-2S)-binding protein [Echinicola arenosa]MBD8489351.1 (2Fe-2S)-binding protein [Echinicola arenosa]
MSQFNLTINQKKYDVDVDPQMPLLWVIRDIIGLTGTKYGCGIAQCGACTIHFDGKAMRSCVLPISNVGDAKITTIEGLSDDGSHPTQVAWKEMDVPQCGYCQAGQIMAAVDLINKKPNPSDEDIHRGMTNVCRCGTYNRIKSAIKLAAEGGKS